MNKKRLLKLAALLEADANDRKGIKFDLSTFGITENGTPSISCRTSACAMGLAAISGAFKRQGLSYHMEGQYINITLPGAYGGFSAAEKLFDIEAPEADWLFSDWSYTGVITGKRGELKVAKRIRDFVAGKAQP